MNGMILKGENRNNIWRKICPSIMWSAMNPTWTGLKLNSDLRGERPETNCVSYDTASSG
jgi:hypothetical protein